MELDAMPLARQIDFVFRQLEKELTNAAAGTVMIHIRNNAIGKFGLKNNPIESRNGKLETAEKGMTPKQVQAFRQLAIDALKLRRDWTHGEILYDFSVRPNQDSWSASISYESNYNMSNWSYRNPTSNASKLQSWREL
ncbi:O-methyltransferase [Paenibacillus protaetiae]|uniref:O-methyltransferase n=1 Tax=Paenibacillus protaetiae TaxID=2509456 RepID=A0A4P6F215_9BACL|nr:O-methyltransferase [Paenibacillus protaetiae]QAY68189.1 O-methyltransferase [Paenibacillus protaetiae]